MKNRKAQQPWPSTLIKAFFTTLITYTLVISPIALAKDTTNDNVSFSKEHLDKIAKKNAGQGISEMESTQQWLALANSLVIGYLTAGVAIKCRPLKTDMYVAGAAGATYIASEIYSTIEDKRVRDEIEQEFQNAIKAQEDKRKAGLPGISQKQNLEENQLEEHKKAIEAADAAADSLMAAAGNDRELQVEALEVQKKAYDKLAETAATKEILQYAAAGAFGVAAILAFFESTKIDGYTPVSCQKTVTSRGRKPELQLTASLFAAKIKGYHKQSKELKEEAWKKAFKRFFAGGMNFLFPPAQAFDLFSHLGIVGAGAGIILGIALPLEGMLHGLMSQPPTRGVAWGVFAGTLAVSAKITGDIKKEMEDRSQELDKLLTKYREKADKQKKQQGLAGEGQKKPKKQYIPYQKQKHKPVILGEKTNTGIPCLTKKNSQGQCAKLPTLTPDQQSQLKSFNPGLANLTQSALQVGEGLNNKKAISSGTLKKAATLGGKSALLGKRLKQAKKSFLKGLKKKSGSRAVAQLRKLESDFKKRLNDNALKAFRKHGMEPSSLLASQGFGNSRFFGEKGQSGSELTAGKLGSKRLGIKAAASLKRGAAGMEMKKKKSKGAAQFELDFGDLGEGQSEATEEDGADNGDLLGLELEQEDISINSDADIFKMISLRYKKTAYPTLFDEIE